MTPPREGLPPPRLRATSQPDAEVPESVYHALHGVQKSVEALSHTVATGQAATESRLASQDKALAELKASGADRWVNLARVLVPAVAVIIGGQRLLAPEQHATPAPVVRSLHDLRLDECRPLPPDSDARFECFRRVNEQTEQVPKR